MKYIERTITPALLERASKFPAVFVTGPRQSGKSTLVKHVFPAYDYVNFEEIDVRRLQLKTLAASCTNTTTGLFLTRFNEFPNYSHTFKPK